MADGGYIKLHRRIQKSAVWEDEGVLKLWLALLLRATGKPRTTVLKVGREARVISLEAGQYVIRTRLFAQDLRISRNTLDRRLAILEELKCVRIERTPKYLLTTVLNWLDYQRHPSEAGSRTEPPSADAGSPVEPPSEPPSEPHHKNEFKNKNSSRPRSATPDQATEGNGRQKPALSDGDRETASWIWDAIRAMQPTRKRPDLAKWADAIRLMRQRDGRTDQAIRETFAAANRDSFWRTNILSPDKLRAKWDDLRLKLALDRPGRNGKAVPLIDADTERQLAEIDHIKAAR